MAIENVTDADFEQKLNGNKVIVKYFADWCGSCKLFAPKFKRIANDENNAGITFLEVNAEENEMARKKGGVDNLPYFATFHNGQLVKGTATSKEEVVNELISELKSA
jgi:thiol-disulfide isomerase/thioredoxin